MSSHSSLTNPHRIRNAGYEGYYAKDGYVYSPEDAYPLGATYITFSEVPELIDGVGPDAPIVTAPNGAKQSKVNYRFDLLDGPAMFVLAGVLRHGAEKYGVDNWRGIPTREHVNHAFQHIFAWLAGDKSDDHLGHAFCRMMMAVAMDIGGTAS